MPATTEHVELPITGMTCASCANRIERKLNKLDGVTATVNYATEKATVDFDPEAVAPTDLVGAVEAARASGFADNSEEMIAAVREALAPPYGTWAGFPTGLAGNIRGVIRALSA